MSTEQQVEQLLQDFKPIDLEDDALLSHLATVKDSNVLGALVKTIVQDAQIVPDQWLIAVSHSNMDTLPPTNTDVFRWEDDIPPELISISKTLNYSDKAYLVRAIVTGHKFNPSDYALAYSGDLFYGFSLDDIGSPLGDYLSHPTFEKSDILLKFAKSAIIKNSDNDMLAGEKIARLHAVSPIRDPEQQRELTGNPLILHQVRPSVFDDLEYQQLLIHLNRDAWGGRLIHNTPDLGLAGYLNLRENEAPELYERWQSDENIKDAVMRTMDMAKRYLDDPDNNFLPNIRHSIQRIERLTQMSDIPPEWFTGVMVDLRKHCITKDNEIGISVEDFVASAVFLQKNGVSETALEPVWGNLHQCDNPAFIERAVLVNPRLLTNKSISHTLEHALSNDDTYDRALWRETATIVLGCAQNESLAGVSQTVIEQLFEMDESDLRAIFGADDSDYQWKAVKAAINTLLSENADTIHHTMDGLLNVDVSDASTHEQVVDRRHQPQKSF